MSRAEAYERAIELYDHSIKTFAARSKAEGRGAYNAVTSDTEAYHRRILAIANYLMGGEQS